MEFLQFKAIATMGSKNCGLKHKPIEASGVYPPGRSLGLLSTYSSSKIVGFEAQELERHGGDVWKISPRSA
jgi:hypothetical protein